MGSKTTLSSFAETLQTISIGQLATALGCDESTIYRWLKDETLQLPRPIQVGKKKVCFIYEEVKEWLYSRPRIICFYNSSLNKIETTETISLASINIDNLIPAYEAVEIMKKHNINISSNAELTAINIKGHLFVDRNRFEYEFLLNHFTANNSKKEKKEDGKVNIKKIIKTTI
ncbi:helix-turn-helix transcriptional regulator [Gilliamella sp. ESL0250]|uniref:helix-turn-helix transcriptional regulator n=1 Tax=Gilliamella sp. ESL0250 TaxID=2705036 RepID=UPI001580E5F0|nr:AlpA family phage regulatory protein [Gilliamella sp. ESL0250]NUF50699.1 AlpA family phage regulatory protein [Gilliamella sp. ESL0250]